MTEATPSQSASNTSRSKQFEQWVQDLNPDKMQPPVVRSPTSWAKINYKQNDAVTKKRSITSKVLWRVAKWILWSLFIALELWKASNPTQTKSLDELTLGALQETGFKGSTSDSAEATAPSMQPSNEQSTDPTPPPSASPSRSTTTPEDVISEAAGQEFLKRLRDDTEQAAQDARDEAAVLKVRETAVFWGMMSAATITIILVVTGIILVFRGSLTIGVVSGAVGLLPAAGTVILSRLANSLSRRREQQSMKAEENRKVLQAIQASLMIPDSKRRSASIADLSDKLALRAK